MRIPVSWLTDLVDVDLDVDGLSDLLTMAGLTVEDVHTAAVSGVVVAEVLDVAKIEGADRLHVVTVSDGERERRIVCGADNFGVGDRVPAALPGAVLPGGVEIGRRTVFGVTSDGMLASPRELGVGDDHRGIWVLDADAPVGADVVSHVGLSDPVLELEVPPDRGYALSVQGVARDVAALTGVDVREPALDHPRGDPGVPVTIEATDRCARFDARRLAGVQVGPSPAWMQRRLAAAGMRPISNVVDATNYAMLELGNPIHAYDVDLLSGPAIVVRTAAAGERLTTLDGIERRLDPDDLVIADADAAVGLAGVMGGEHTEINAATTDVLVEVASFSARTVRRTVRRHGLRTEGSVRWERGVPADLAPYAATRCVQLLTEHASAALRGGSDTYPVPAQRPVITLRGDRARAHLGLGVSDDEQARLLTTLGCAVDGDGPIRQVTPPWWRPDLRIAEDLHEEIVRLHGYDRLPATLPAVTSAGAHEPRGVARRAVRRALAGGGWTEALTFPFVGADDVARLEIPADDRRRASIPLVNPLSDEESVLRTTMLPGLLRAARRGVARGVGDLAMYEIGHVFLVPTPDDPGAEGGPEAVELPAEPTALGIVACGRFVPDRHDAPGREVDVFDALGALDLVRVALGLEAFDVSATHEPPYHPGRAARLSWRGRQVGSVGELHPRVCDAWDLPRRTVAGEVRVDDLLEQGVSPVGATVPSPLPGLRFDVAVEVDSATPAAVVEEAVRAGAGPRLTSLTLFDVYSGASIGEGRTSLAWRVQLDDARTQLTDADEAAAIDAIAASVERVGGRLRR